MQSDYSIVSRSFPGIFNHNTFKKYTSILTQLDDADYNSLRFLYRKGLLHKINIRGKAIYRPTPKCVILLILSSESFRDNRVIMNMLTDRVYEGNSLALALILIGLVDGKDRSIYNTLLEYATVHVIDGLDDSVVAESLLDFLSRRIEGEKKGIPEYIDILRDFTSSTLDNVLKVIIASIRPKVEDYNAFIQFMHEVVRFYYDPIRIAYTRIVEERGEFKSRLDEFRGERDLSMILSKSNGKRDEINISFELDTSIHSRLLSMPYYLQLIMLKLIVEPRGSELCSL
jgi:hypothetical protein